MAVEKLASGRIFVGAPYKRTAAENYVSLYTKSRLEEFERAQKDARDEAELQKLSYKAQLAAYQERIKANERMRAKLADLRVRVQNKEIDDQTARQALALTLGEKAAAREDAMTRAREEVRPYSTGTTTTTTGGTGGGGGGAAKLPDLNPSPETQKELDALKGRLGSGADTDSQLGAVADALGPRGEVQGDDPNDTRRALGQEAARAAKQYEGEYLSQGVDPAEAKAKARRRAKAVVASRNPAMAADVDQYFGEVDAVEAGVPVTGGGGGGTRTSTSSRDVGFYSPRGDVGPATQAGAAVVPEVPSRQSVLDEIARAETGIEAPEAPTVPTFDPFTRGRSLYGQRFGPTVPIPAYAERNLTRTLLDLPPEMQAQIGKSYRDYLAQQEAAARVTPAKEAIVAQVTDDAALAATPAPAVAPEVVPPVAPAPEVAPAPAAPPAPTPEALPPEPAEPRIAPTPAAPPAPEPYVEDAETIALRKKAMAAARAREFAAKQAELQALMDKRAADRSLVSGMFAGYDAISEPQSGRMKAFMEAAPYMPMSPPPQPRVQTLPQRTPPEQRPAPVIMPRINTDRAAELALLGVKPEGELVLTPPAAAPAAKPVYAPKMEPKGPGPLAAKSPEDIERETDAQVLAASELSALTKALVEDEKFRERMLRTKPGEFAAKVYRANLEAKKGLNATQNTVVDEYMGNTKDMKTALAVAYALDALNKPVAPVKALTK